MNEAGRSNAADCGVGSKGEVALEERVDRWVTELFGADHAVTRHLRRTVYWLEQLRPGADPALRLAALSHDVQRAAELWVGSKLSGPVTLTGKEYLGRHQQQGAQMVAKFLAAAGAEEELVRRVEALVASHEVGGDDGGDALMDADSVSFFENSVEYLLKKLAVGQGTPELRNKFEWMFERVVSDRARELARPMYVEAMRRLQFSPHTAISAVIWDMGGVMYRFFTELMVELGREQGWPVERLPLGPTGPGPDLLYAAMDRGELGEPEYVKKLVAALEREAIAFSPYRDLEFANHDRPRTWVAIARLQQAGFRQVVLTNDATRWLGERWWETWEHRCYFEAIVDVATLGVRKPAPAPYLACASKLDLAPQACLFVDDMRVNCQGAEAVGMHSHWFDITDPEGSLIGLLERVGVRCGCETR